MVETALPLSPKEKISSGKKILVLGGLGMVGSRFLENYEGNFLNPHKEELDITDKATVKEFIEKEKPDVIVNFSAFTAVNKGEEQRGDIEGKCWQLNVEGVRNIIDAIDPDRTHFIQISTDMVFSGSEVDPGPYDEYHPVETNPDKLTWYGYTKAEAERIILEKLGEKATIIRTIYPVTDYFSGKLDYLRLPLSKYKKDGKLYPLFNDQQVNITDVDDIARVLKIIIENKYQGIFHVGSPDFSNPHKIISGFLSLIEDKEVLLEQRPMGEMEKRYARYGGLKTQSSRTRLGTNYSEIGEIQRKLLRKGVDKKLFQ